MNQRLADINWDAANCFRLATVIIQTMLVLEFMMLLSHYHWRISTLRKELDEGRVIAPPVRWTFAYHIVVTFIVTLTDISTMQRLVFNAKPTLSTWLIPVASLALLVVVKKFVEYYSDRLNEAEHDDHFHQ